MRLLPPPDPDAMAGRGQARQRLLNRSQEIEHRLDCQNSLRAPHRRLKDEQRQSPPRSFMFL